LIISSDRGLCGAYNTNVFRKASTYIRSTRAAGTNLDVEVSGKKAIAAVRFHGISVANKHTIGDKPKYEEVERIAARYIEEFTAGKYDSVRVAYTRFESNARQIPEVLQLLPVKASGAADDKSEPAASANYEFSPSAEDLMSHLLPLSVKSTLFQAFNDAVVSEQIMRMVAMKAATENAKELGRLLRRKYNRARQSKITTELTEIVSGAAALE
jgi:F-type H+-transporting ATPase subunit gamma